MNTRDLEEPSLRMTQPVLLQSFEDEFDLSQMGKPGIQAPAGLVLSKGDKTESEAVPLAQQAYRKDSVNYYTWQDGRDRTSWMQYETYRDLQEEL
jgi:hypothetical protein